MMISFFRRSGQTWWKPTSTASCLGSSSCAWPYRWPSSSTSTRPSSSSSSSKKSSLRRITREMLRATTVTSSRCREASASRKIMTREKKSTAGSQSYKVNYGLEELACLVNWNGNSSKWKVYLSNTSYQNLCISEFASGGQIDTKSIPRKAPS